MNAVVETPDNTFVDGMTNDDYRQLNRGISTSDIKNIIKDPASLIWSQNANQDKNKLSTIDFGTDFHLYFLEPETFNDMYRVLPVFNRRKPDEKIAELDLIEKWRKEGIVPVKAEDFEKCKAMRDSALAHPTVAAIMSMSGVAERSYFWTDPLTGIRCKCRPDWLVEGINDNNRPPFMSDDCTTLVMDVKTIGQIDRIQPQIEDLKYYVQDAFYSRGISAVNNTSVCFVFAFVSTSLSLGRYSVQVVMLNDAARFEGLQECKEALQTYSTLMASDESAWQTVITMDRPTWAKRDEEIL